MDEHDDDLEIGAAHEAAVGDATPAAVARGLERIASALEVGLREVAAAIVSAAATPRRARDRERRRSVAHTRGV